MPSPTFTTISVGVEIRQIHHRAAIRSPGYDEGLVALGVGLSFGAASQPRFLLRYAKRFNDLNAPPMVLHMCDRMAAGGIHDQLGGGFARYSVDAEWLVPHFEKMLYDNAQLAQLYLDATLFSGESVYAGVARDILDYVRHDMSHPGGGFYSAEDADSEGYKGNSIAGLAWSWKRCSRRRNSKRPPPTTVSPRTAISGTIATLSPCVARTS